MAEKLGTMFDQALKLVSDANADGVVVRGNKRYTQVSQRVEAFRKAYRDNARISTEIIVNDGKLVLIKATIYVLHNNVLTEVANGYAEEIRNSSNVNKTSALENCETSAIGRALAAFGLHGGEFASDNEVETAIKQQGQGVSYPQKAPSKAQNKRAGELLNSAVKEAEKGVEAFRKFWKEADQQAREILQPELTRLQEIAEGAE